MQLRRLRLQKGLTQQQLAKKANGMSYTFLSNIERGKADPSLSTLKRLATALGVTVSELVQEPTRLSKRR